MASNDIFKQIGTTVTEAGKGGLEKAKELRDTARITLEIRDRETSIQKAYRELGKAYYQDHRNDEDPVYDQVVYIKAAFEEIGELKANKDEIRGIRRCPECGETIPNGASFCPNCGKKYVAPASAAGETDDAEEEEIILEVFEADDAAAAEFDDGMEDDEAEEETDDGMKDDK